MLDLLRPYWAAIRAALLVAALLAALAGVHLYNEHERGVGRAQTQAQWDRATALGIRLRQERIDAARAAQDRLQKEANDERQQARDREAALAARADDLARRLRERPSRPAAAAGAAVPRPPGPGPEGPRGCTGADLYRDDGELLVRFAHTAERIKSQRDACYEQYGRAQAALRALNAR